jgi:hypothetical protein
VWAGTGSARTSCSRRAAGTRPCRPSSSVSPGGRPSQLPTRHARDNDDHHRLLATLAPRDLRHMHSCCGYNCCQHRRYHLLASAGRYPIHTGS